jgi:hypothetical protein
MTARHLVGSSHTISEGTEIPQLKTRRNTAKIVVGLTVVFLISYVPYHVFWTYIIWTKDYETLVSINYTISFHSNYGIQHLISKCLILINSCLNPVALFYTGSPSRRLLKRYFNCFYKTISPSTDLKITGRN